MIFLNGHRMATGHLEASPITSELFKLVEDRVSIFTNNLRNKNITIRNDIERSIFVFADIQMIIGKWELTIYDAITKKRERGG